MRSQLSQITRKYQIRSAVQKTPLKVQGASWKRERHPGHHIWLKADLRSYMSVKWYAARQYVFIFLCSVTYLIKQSKHSNTQMISRITHGRTPLWLRIPGWDAGTTTFYFLNSEFQKKYISSISLSTLRWRPKLIAFNLSMDPLKAVQDVFIGPHKAFLPFTT